MLPLGLSGRVKVAQAGVPQVLKNTITTGDHRTDNLHLLSVNYFNKPLFAGARHC
jgi:hypothetical protein